ncbi:MAG: hypothetical protein LBF78_02290 [Treponema sp.]|jgi:hypothetical protein|nr:hypothetical protein [Treponema sp.]
MTRLTFFEVDETDVRGAVQRMGGKDGAYLGGQVLVTGCGGGAAGVGGGGVLGCGGGGGRNADTGGPETGTAAWGQPPEGGKGGGNPVLA